MWSSEIGSRFSSPASVVISGAVGGEDRRTAGRWRGSPTGWSGWLAPQAPASDRERDEGRRAGGGASDQSHRCSSANRWHPRANRSHRPPCRAATVCLVSAPDAAWSLPLLDDLARVT